MANWLRLKRRDAAPLQRLNDEVIVYADEDGGLRTIDEEGTDSAVGGNGGSQPFELLGPFEIAFGDVASSPFHCFTLDAGTVILAAWGFVPETFDFSANAFLEIQTPGNWPLFHTDPSQENGDSDNGAAWWPLGGAGAVGATVGYTNVGGDLLCYIGGDGVVAQGLAQIYALVTAQS